MEIKEVVEFFLNKTTNLIEVSFRTIEDDDEVLRTDVIDYTISEDYGYELQTDTFDFFSDDEEDDVIDEDKIELDEEMLIMFLNEYYTVNSHVIPKPEIY